ncbi:hypothetical protein CSV79_12930 [Sporosarcina sp. P13]|uniref:NAD-binding protein n=1 Tax=Sporosarcina sp. P13 TaxID=2048263 RepID=UPI000C16C368|nr:NAD-binding protein [Sporosarcina sp. P13]PIC63240.1 hypothetical protein CSV79_12930 [Sporosarcina sp. P13]
MYRKLQQLNEGAISDETETLKSLNALLYATNLLTAYEGLAIAKKAGIKPDVFIDAINASSGQSYITKTLLSCDKQKTKYGMDSTISSIYTSFSSTVEIARLEAVPLMFTSLTQEIFAMAINQGLSADSNECMSDFIEETIGV